MLTHIDLFSGIGGFALAARWAGFQTVCFVEIDEYAQAVIRKNFGAVKTNVVDRKIEPFDYDIADVYGEEIVADTARHEQGRQEQWPIGERVRQCGEPILYADIRTFDGTGYAGATLLTGGFPCQPFSQAGKRTGKEDDRYLWPQMHRVIAESKPSWVVAENVAGIVTMELDNVLSDLEGEGYECQSFIIPACAVDARHRRDRVWIVAKSNAERCGWGSDDEGQTEAERNRATQAGIVGHAVQPGGQQVAGGAHGDEGANERRAALHADELAGAGEDVADAEQPIRRGRSSPWWRQREYSETSPDGWGRCGQANGEWLPEPNVGRVAHGIPRRVDRLKGLGNSIVPQVAYEILRVIAEIETSVLNAQSSVL